MESKKKVRVRPSDIPPLANAFSGAIGGAVANLSVFPLDLITTRLQIQTKVKTEETYDGVWDAVMKIYKSGGILTFYDGAASDTAATMGQAFLYFLAYEKIRSTRIRSLAAKRQGKAPSTLGVGEELLIGSLAGIFAKFFICPLNNIVTRQQTAGLIAHDKKEEHVHDDDIGRVIQSILKERGIRGFWSGYKATVLLSINPSLTYYFFQLFKALTLPRRRRDNPTSVELFFLAAWAKTLATLITYPIILAKTRSQVIQAAKGTMTIVGQIYRTLQTEGLAGLYMGARSQILKGFFSQGITMMTKDQIAKLIIYMYFVSKKHLF